MRANVQRGDWPIRLLLGSGLALLGLWAYLVSDRWFGPQPNYSWPIPGYEYPVAPRLAGPDDPRLLRRPTEDDLSFAIRVSRAVFAAVYHCEDNAAAQSWLISLRTAAHLQAAETEGVLAAEGLRCGLCHQVSYVAASALRRGGVEAEVFGLTGHVVVRFVTGGREYFIDPDWGLGPFDPSSPHFEAELRNAYRPFATLRATYQPIRADDLLNNVVAAYLTPDDNVPYGSMPGLDAIAARQARMFMAQKWAERLILFFGLGALATAGALWVRSGRYERRAKRRLRSIAEAA